MASVAFWMSDSQVIDEHIAQVLQKEFDGYKAYTSLDELEKNSEDFDAIVLKGQDDPNLYELIRAIKSRDSLFLVPLLISEDGNQNRVIDGDLVNLHQSKDRIRIIQSRIAELDIQQVDWQSKFLYFLFTRSDLKLAPACHWKHTTYYYYPLLEYFVPDDTTYRGWLDHLITQQILKPSQLEDKLFLCPYCHGAHLKLSEQCPHCHSIDIELAEFLHCFTCGLIGPQVEFFQEDRLVCPRCHSRLRHVGDDYDRPLESGLCNNCNNFYVDSEVSVSCMLCNKTYSTEMLRKWTVQTFELTDKGKNKIRFNTDKEVMGVFDKINYINPDFFYVTLNWMIAMQKRYPEDVFSIIGIHFARSLDEQYGVFIQNFAEQLKLILRKTDFLTRLQERTIWILLPKTSQKGCETVRSRIHNVGKDPSYDIDKHLSITYYSSEAIDAEQETAQLLLGRLGSQL
jgi:hypothetical protein